MSELAHSSQQGRYKPPGRWKKGESGNPAGRPKGLEEQARKHTPAALERLVRALEDPDSKVAVTAASILLDRGWGKPKQQIETPDMPAQSITFLHLTAARAHSEQMRNDVESKTIEVVPEQEQAVDLMAPARE